MMFRDVLDLLETDEATNENGFSVLTVKSKTRVFANKKSVRSNEFYLASQSGFSLELMFEVRSIEYSLQKFLEYESKRYEIVRAYDRGEFTELVCQAHNDKTDS